MGSVADEPATEKGKQTNMKNAIKTTKKTAVKATKKGMSGAAAKNVEAGLTKKTARPVKATANATAKKVKASATDGVETKGKSKVTVEDVLNMRMLKVQNPGLSAQKIKDQLNLRLSAIMVGRCLRGISHSHIDMCGLPVRPFEHGKAVQVKLDRKAFRQTKKAEKAATKKTAAGEVTADVPVEATGK
jgi:hypothetical protein